MGKEDSKLVHLLLDAMDYLLHLVNRMEKCVTS